MPSVRLLLVCCFLDEERHLPAFLESIAEQVRRPDRLLLVDDGCTDASATLAAAFAAEHDFARLVHRPRRPQARDRLAQAAELRAFHWGMSQVDEPFDVVGKIDADLRLTPRTLEQLEQRLRDDPRLGLIGPYLSEIGPDGVQRRDEAPPLHVRGALKLYRRECFQQVEPIPEILGWDTIDEIAARMHGWRTGSQAMPDGDPLHLRPTGAQDGSVRAFRRWGACAWGFGAHPLHVLLGGARRVAERPRLVGALNYLAGWAQAGLRRAPRAGADVRAQGRREQLSRIRRSLRPGPDATT
jgi:biofilm PGA synthesis N-glycosyltransferase PgaC